jgi:hypothetical protein
MNIEEYKKYVNPFIDRIFKKHIKDTSKGNPANKITDESLKLLKSEGLDQLLGVYDLINGFNVEWKATFEHSPPSSKNSEIGKINLVSIEEMLSPSGSVNLNQLETWTIYDVGGSKRNAALSGRFIPVDTIGDICSGIFDNGDPKLYFHDFGNSFYSLDLDIFGYFKMVLKSNGYSFWQQALVYHLYSKDESSTYGQSTYDDFVEDMPVIFKEFDLDEYLAFFESLRISKKE